VESAPSVPDCARMYCITMTFRGNVVMLTGAAGTGKSALAKEAGARIRPLHRVDFGQTLLNRKIAQGCAGLTYERLRAESASLISPEDVKAADAELIQSLPGLREEAHVLIDSHAVTRERYGFRITHYSLEDLRRMALDAVIFPYCDPAVLVRRHKNDPQGRPPITEVEAQHHMSLQEAVAVNYAIVCGCRCFLLDTTTRTPSDLAGELGAVFESLRGIVR
jgi:adenylate kinase